MLSPGLEQTTNPLSNHTFTRATQAQMKEHKWIAPLSSFILNPLIRNSRSYTDPKTQKCAAVRHYKIQQIPMVYEGTLNLSYLIQLPLNQDRRCQLAHTDSSTCIARPANHKREPYRHRTHLNVPRQGPKHLPDNKAIG